MFYTVSWALPYSRHGGHFQSLWVADVKVILSGLCSLVCVRVRAVACVAFITASAAFCLLCSMVATFSLLTYTCILCMCVSCADARHAVPRLTLVSCGEAGALTVRVLA